MAKTHFARGWQCFANKLHGRRKGLTDCFKRSRAERLSPSALAGCGRSGQVRRRGGETKTYASPTQLPHSFWAAATRRPAVVFFHMLHSIQRFPHRPGEIKKPLSLSHKQGRGSNHLCVRWLSLSPTFPARPSFSTVSRKRRSCLSHLR